MELISLISVILGLVNSYYLVRIFRTQAVWASHICFTAELISVPCCEQKAEEELVSISATTEVETPVQTAKPPQSSSAWENRKGIPICETLPPLPPIVKQQRPPLARPDGFV